MKLLIVIVRDVDADNIVQALVEKEFRVTRMASTGGFLRRGNVTLLVGIDEGKKGEVVEILKAKSGPADPDQHRATVFVVDMPYFEQIS